ncbi:hypothetical protein [Sphingobacterium multivorum]|uniref:hypothetical protein n=1 Tax=Sphingobacterium multivorum TaxID=28454 RepID=UPI0028A9E76B|nr:hypothetical protein [Sphingobacterium multivorum]
MNNEKKTKQYSGRPHKRYAKNAVPAAVQLYKRSEKAKGCTGSRRRKKAVRSPGNTSLDFLKQSFLPAVGEKELKKNPQLTITNEMNVEYKDSLSQLKDFYNIGFLEADTGQFAFNWLIDFEKLSMLLNSGEHLEVDIAPTEYGKISLITRQTFLTGHSLYYIPVLPLYRFLKDKQFRKNRSAVLVLLSACSYLYRHAGVPMYTQPGTFMEYQYEILCNWCEEDEEEAKCNDLMELRQIIAIGPIMERKFHHKNNLLYLEDRIKRLRPRDGFDRLCQRIGNQTLELYKQFPNENIFRLAATVNHNEYDYHYTTLMENYIAFVGSSEGGISDMLLDMVNNELSENNHFQEPEIVQVFDGRSNEPIDFCFERAIFKLLNDVCTLLYKY